MTYKAHLTLLLSLYIFLSGLTIVSGGQKKVILSGKDQEVIFGHPYYTPEAVRARHSKQ